MTDATRPPRLAETLVEALLSDPDTRDAVVGDLLEDHAAIVAQHGCAAAARWYRTQVVRSTPALLQTTMLQFSVRDWVRAVGLVLLAYVMLSALVIAGHVLLQFIEPERPEVPSLVMSSVCAIAGGYLAARVSRRAPLANAVALGLFCVLVSIVLCLTATDGTPMWYQLALAALVLPGSTTGGILRVLTSRPS
jgi:hypothetical protein